MAWLILFVAGLCEIAWAIGLKFTDGFTRTVPTVIVVAAMIASVWLLAIALKTIPVGTGYAVWTGIGAAGTFMVGVLYYGDPTSLARYLGVALIIAGVITLKLAH